MQPDVIPPSRTYIPLKTAQKPPKSTEKTVQYPPRLHYERAPPINID